MLTLCAKPLPPEEPDEGENMRELRELQRKSLHDVIHELVRQVTSPNNHVREQGRKLFVADVTFQRVSKYTVGRRLSRDVLFSFLSQVPVTNWAAQ